MSRSKGQICLNMWYLRKGLVPRNTYEKYQSSSIHCSKVIRKLNVSDRITVTKLWNDRQDKNNMPPPTPIFDLGGTEITMPGLYKNHSRCSDFSKLTNANRQIDD